MGSDLRARSLVAGFVDESGNLADPFAGGALRVYEIGPEGPRLVGERPFRLGSGLDLERLRLSLKTLAADLGDCRLLALGRARGILPALLGDLGVAVVEAQGSMESFVAALRAEAPAREPTGEPARKPAKPRFVGLGEDGVLTVDLATALSEEGGPTSKEILRPLLESRGFELLEVLCDHEPRWLAAEAEGLGYSLSSEERPGERPPLVLRLAPLSGFSGDRVSAGAFPSGLSSGCSSGCSGGCAARRGPSCG